MKDLILVLISFAVGYFAAITDTQAQTQFFYGPNGQSAGTAIKSGNSTYFYGPQGQSAGTVMNSAVPVYTPIPMYTQPTQSLTPMFDSVFGR